MCQVLIPAVILGIQAVLAPPAAVRADLDGRCTGWQLAPVIPEISEEIRTRTPSWPPNLLPGDFNGDQQTDVAVLVECRGRSQLIVYFGSSSGFSPHVLEQPQPYDARQFLHLIRKEYEFDAIGVEFEAIGGHAWVWRGGRWRSVAR